MYPPTSGAAVGPQPGLEPGEGQGWMPQNH